MADELDAYYRDFDECVARSEGCKWLRVYARGQLGPLERKSLEPIADAEEVAPRTLQWFFLRNGRDEDRVLAVHQHRVAEELGGEDGIFVIDETSDAKKGEWTAGTVRRAVARGAGRARRDLRRRGARAGAGLDRRARR